MRLGGRTGDSCRTSIARKNSLRYSTRPITSCPTVDCARRPAEPCSGCWPRAGCGSARRSLGPVATSISTLVCSRFARRSSTRAGWYRFINSDSGDALVRTAARHDRVQAEQRALLSARQRQTRQCARHPVCAALDLQKARLEAARRLPARSASRSAAHPYRCEPAPRLSARRRDRPDHARPIDLCGSREDCRYLLVRDGHSGIVAIAAARFQDFAQGEPQ